MTSPSQELPVLVAGGGVAGLTAALAAAKTGASVILVDENAEVGGALRFDTGAVIDGLSGYDWAQKVFTELKSLPNVRVLTRTTAFGYYNHNFEFLKMIMKL